MPRMNRYGLIIAGGSGTRLWPMSRAQQPKQLIPFIGGRSLLEVAVDRLDGLIDPSRILICTAERFRDSIRRALPRVSDEQILGEPEGRDTLAAVGLPAAVVSGRDPDAAIAVFTADHLIEPVELFQRRVATGFDVVEREPGRLVTFGIQPTFAATGFGYVQLGERIEGFDGVFTAKQFKEKPDAAAAKRHVDSGEYRWNSGMFVWRAGTLMGCIQRYEPGVYAGLMRIAEAWDTPGRRAAIEAEYPNLKKISVDYAVLERAAADPAVGVATVSMPVEWRDVGSWTALGETLQPDAEGNRTGGVTALTLDATGNILVGDDPHHLIAAIGVHGLVIVRTASATLICPRGQVERIKQLHAEIGNKLGSDYL